MKIAWPRQWQLLLKAARRVESGGTAAALTGECHQKILATVGISTTMHKEKQRTTARSDENLLLAGKHWFSYRRNILLMMMYIVL